jgi:CheY-like chemotaxis protein
MQSMLPLLRRTLDPRIEVTLDLGASRHEIAGDVSQLEQVLMNLVFNARDAMPDGGRLVLRTRNIELTGEDARSPLKPGLQLIVEVCDSGVGIDPSVRDRIFEPYFTTKIAGAQRGSGLGLATAYGIVESHHGTIEAIDAQPRGTIMRLTFPLAPPSATRRTPVVTREPARSGTGTVLLVEDEALVRVATFRTLKQLGYRVIACEDGDEAVEIFRERHTEITAVMLDMMMPRMSGRQTYVAMREIDPEVRVLLTTGFAHNEEVQRILSLGVRGFIAKPYELTSLSQALAKVIEA